MLTIYIYILHIIYTRVLYTYIHICVHVRIHIYIYIITHIPDSIPHEVLSPSKKNQPFLMRKTHGSFAEHLGFIPTPGLVVESWNLWEEDGGHGAASYVRECTSWRYDRTTPDCRSQRH